MRVIENNYKGKERTIICPHCSSVIAYEWDSLDRHITKSGRSYICCGACHETIYINENDIDHVPINEFDEIPTADTIQYPKDFFSYTNGAPIKDDEINKWVKTVIVAKKYQETDVKISRKNF